MKIFFNWFMLLLIIAAIVILIWHRHWIINKLPSVQQMSGAEVVVFSLACAFVWVEILKWGVTKPFNCLKCMTAWAAVILAFTFHVQFWPLYLPLGVFTGAIFEGIRMRWL